MTKQLYKYRITIKRVVDGDTVICMVDLGFKCYVEKIVRLAGINAPEMNSPDAAEREKAGNATKYLVTILEGFKTLTLESHKLDIYGRSIGTIFADNDLSINQAMIDSGNAVEHKY